MSNAVPNDSCFRGQIPNWRDETTDIRSGKMILVFVHSAKKKCKKNANLEMLNCNCFRSFAITS